VIKHPCAFIMLVTVPPRKIEWGHRRMSSNFDSARAGHACSSSPLPLATLWPSASDERLQVSQIGFPGLRIECADGADGMAAFDSDR